ncbi:MAG: penicillin-binding protein 2 [Candidatus Omnitrophica bacterium]|nr:penicillin-binding protein 2 [Candidatus Omnitrophota bacterium]
MFGKIYKTFLISSLSIIILQTAYLQIARGRYYRDMSLNNYLRVLPLKGYRGNILDRYGRELAVNQLKFAVNILPDRLKNKKDIFSIITEEFNINEDELERIYRLRFRAPFAPLTLISDVDFNKALYFKEKYRNISGLFVSENIERFYPNGRVASHILGYLGEISGDELVELKPYGYRYSSYIGKSGIEKQYEPYLKGSDGGMLVKVDNQGRIVEVLNREEPERGLDVYLTVDLDLQKAADDMLANYKGCILVMDVRTGDMITMSSSPGFDPNAFINSGNSRVAKLLTSDKNPLFNRAIQGEYALGSTFKIVLAEAALEDKAVGQDDKFFCPGYFSYGKSRYRCWKQEGHGWQNLKEAIEHSCNVYFYNTGLKLGADAIAHYAGMFGFGKKTQIDLPYEKSGLLPSPAWKVKNIKESWYPGDTINFSIGQGYFLATPIQALCLMAAIANGGHLLRPRVCSVISGEVAYGIEDSVLAVSEKNLRFIRKAMFDAVNSPSGTGQAARMLPYLAGKTATAQNPHGDSHAWFSGFAPYDNPEIAFLVFIEHGGGGGFISARIAKEFLKYYFKKKESDEPKI